MVLRNISPRQGTETVSYCSLHNIQFIEKYKSPTGDGNDGKNYVMKDPINIEKYKSPTGDGNCVAGTPDRHKSLSLRNISPRQGTETFLTSLLICSSVLRNISPRQGTETI